MTLISWNVEGGVRARVCDTQSILCSVVWQSGKCLILITLYLTLVVSQRTLDSFLDIQ